MRYVWASVVAIAVIAFGVHFVRHTHEGVERMVQKAAADSGQRMPDLGTSNRPNIGIEMSSPRIFQVAVADFLFRFWYVFVLLVLLACFGTAALVGGGSKSSSSNSQTTES
jgi:hypothetical protein